MSKAIQENGHDEETINIKLPSNQKNQPEMSSSIAELI